MQDDSDIILTLKKENNALQNRFSKERALFEQKISLLNIQIEEHKTREFNLQKMNDTIMNVLNDLQSENCKANGKVIKDLQATIYQQQQENQILKSQIAEKQKYYDEQKHQFELKFNEQSGENKDTDIKQEKRILVLEHQLELARQQIRIQSEDQIKVNMNQLLINDLAESYKIRQEKQEFTHSEAINKFKQEKQALLDQTQELIIQLEQKDKQFLIKETQLKQMYDQVSSVIKDNNDLKQFLENLDAQKSKLEETVKDLNSKNNQLILQIKNLELTSKEMSLQFEKREQDMLKIYKSESQQQQDFIRRLKYLLENENQIQLLHQSQQQKIDVQQSGLLQKTQSFTQFFQTNPQSQKQFPLHAIENQQSNQNSNEKLSLQKNYKSDKMFSSQLSHITYQALQPSDDEYKILDNSRRSLTDSNPHKKVNQWEQSSIHESSIINEEQKKYIQCELCGGCSQFQELYPLYEKCRNDYSELEEIYDQLQFDFERSKMEWAVRDEDKDCENQNLKSEIKLLMVKLLRAQASTGPSYQSREQSPLDQSKVSNKASPKGQNRQILQNNCFNKLNCPKQQKNGKWK